MAHGEDAGDHNLPKMLWLGVEPLVRGNPALALEHAGRSSIPLLAQFIARRAVDADNADAVVAAIAKTPKSVDQPARRSARRARGTRRRDGAGRAGPRSTNA